MADEGRQREPEQAQRAPRPAWQTALFYSVAVLLWLLFSVRRLDGASGAEQAGYVFGTLFFTLAIAAILRLVYVKLVRRKARLPFLSPWLFIIAAAIGLLALIGRVAGDLAERSEAERVVQASAGSESADVVDCVEGGLTAYDDAGPEHPARQEFSRDEYTKVLVRVCREAERRGLFERGEAEA